MPSTPTVPAVPTTEPTEPPDTTAPDVVFAVPSQNGNFVFYLSDAPNDIADFKSLTVVVDSIELKPVDGPSVNIMPDLMQVDLTQLQGNLAQEVWRGDIPDGDYKTVLVHVSAIEGTLTTSGEKADVTLPSNTLRVSLDFSVTAHATTDFVFDITVHRTGNAGAGVRYVISPQASESGIDRPISRVAKDSGQSKVQAGDQGSRAVAPGSEQKPDSVPSGRMRVRVVGQANSSGLT